MEQRLYYKQASAEAVTLIADTHDVPDAVYVEARKHFDEKAPVELKLGPSSPSTAETA